MPKQEKLDFENLRDVFPKKGEEEPISEQEVLDAIRNPETLESQPKFKQITFWGKLAEKMNQSENFRKTVLKILQEKE